MSDKAFKSVWDTIEDGPAQAANLKHRTALMMVIHERHVASFRVKNEWKVYPTDRAPEGRRSCGTA